LAVTERGVTQKRVVDFGVVCISVLEFMFDAVPYNRRFNLIQAKNAINNENNNPIIWLFVGL
jgi:hypothetical protein